MTFTRPTAHSLFFFYIYIFLIIFSSLSFSSSSSLNHDHLKYSSFAFCTLSSLPIWLFKLISICQFIAFFVRQIKKKKRKTVISMIAFYYDDDHDDHLSVRFCHHLPHCITKSCILAVQSIIRRLADHDSCRLNHAVHGINTFNRV